MSVGGLCCSLGSRQGALLRAIVRVAYSDPMRDYWIECYDLEQSDKPYYYNTYSEETVWKVPLAFKYFGNRAQEEEEEEETDSDDD